MGDLGYKCRHTRNYQSGKLFEGIGGLGCLKRHDRLQLEKRHRPVGLVLDTAGVQMGLSKRSASLAMQFSCSVLAE
jgi:hypothetical protein